MKTIVMSKDFEYQPYGNSRVVIKYISGKTYERVPEAAVSAILREDVGYIPTSIAKRDA